MTVGLYGLTLSWENWALGAIAMPVGCRVAESYHFGESWDSNCESTTFPKQIYSFHFKFSISYVSHGFFSLASSCHKWLSFFKFFSNTLQPNHSFPPLLPAPPLLPSPPDPFLLCFPPEKSKPPWDVNWTSCNKTRHIPSLISRLDKALGFCCCLFVFCFY